MSKIENCACPLCNQSETFLPVTIPSRDPHLSTYGDIYEGLSKSLWKVCGSCGFVHQNPRPSISTLNEFYEQSKYHAPIVHNRRRLDAQYKNAYSADLAFLKRHAPTHVKSVFDVGCGLGYALHKMKDFGWTLSGVEPDEGRFKYAHEELQLKGVQRGLLTRNHNVSQSVDLIFSHHAFEHIADFDDVMSGVVKILKPNGYFFCCVPTYFKNRSNMSREYLNSGHYSSFTHKSIMRLLSKYGFEYVTHEYFNDFGLTVTDDLMILAKFTGRSTETRAFYEDPVAVQRYVNFWNRVRSLVFAPLYSTWFKKLGDLLRVPQLILVGRDPRAFLPLVGERLKRNLRIG